LVPTGGLVEGGAGARAEARASRGDLHRGKLQMLGAGLLGSSSRQDTRPQGHPRA
jgi:hypothetical protein